LQDVSASGCAIHRFRAEVRGQLLLNRPKPLAHKALRAMHGGISVPHDA
jgi:hypothetical protein